MTSSACVILTWLAHGLHLPGHLFNTPAVLTDATRLREFQHLTPFPHLLCYSLEPMGVGVGGGGWGGKYNQELTDFNFQLTKSIREINHSSLTLKPMHDSK